jgi:transposase
VLAEADLPDDIEVLRALVLEQDRKLENADAEVTRLRAMLDAFMRHRFGARSEKLDADQLQLGLEDVETAVAGAEVANDAKSGSRPSDRPRKRNRGALPAHLERVEQVVDVENKDCPCCGGVLHRIGEDVAERLDVVPTTFRVLVTRRPRYGCRSCEGAVVQAPAPPRIVEGGLPTEALIAHVLVAKYADHLPLYRQAQIYARQGIQLDRSTLADWVGRAAWWLRPLRDHILAELRRSQRLFADETTAPVLDPGRGRTKTGQLWAYARDDRPWGGSDPPLVAYVYAADRKAERPEMHLGEFAGILQVDGYGGYAALARRRQQVVLAFCWAHVRRKFYELAATSPVAEEVLRCIAKLYVVEDEVRGLPPEQRRTARNERSRMIVDDLRVYLDARLRQVSAKSKLAEAIRYALTRWDGLTRFLDDGRIDLDSNPVERSIRPLALNRKNALFAGSDEGGDNWAVIATLIECCKLNGVNPHAWLTATLSKLAAGHPPINSPSSCRGPTWAENIGYRSAGAQRGDDRGNAGGPPGRLAALRQHRCADGGSECGRVNATRLGVS